MTARNTNALSIGTAVAIADAPIGRFRSLIIPLQGAERGRGSDRKVFGNDLVHDVFYGGFSYIGLVTRSDAKLPDPGDPTDPAKPATPEFVAYADALVGEFSRRGIRAGNGDPITYADVRKAVFDLKASFAKTVAGANTSTTDHVFEPLVVDGEVVRGAKVYKCVASDPNHECKCRDCTGDKRAPLPGQINISGLRIGRTVIEAAPNGPIPASKSRADVVAKRIIRSRLPVGRYVSYRLEPKGDWVLNVGPAGVTAASNDGVTCDPDKVDTVRDLLAG